MSDKQLDLFGAEAKPESVVESDEQLKAVAGDALKAAKNGERGSCPGRVTVTRRPKDATRVQVCPMCGRDRKLSWVNPGSLGPNQELCKECIPKLFEGYGYEAPGYRIVEGRTVEIFSQTTGWERIKTYWVKGLFGNLLANDLFPVCVHLEDAEIKAGSSLKLGHETLGITWAAARFLSARTGVPVPRAQGPGSAVMG